MAGKVCPTPGFERLLVATDGSEFSKAAVQEAITIASALFEHSSRSCSSSR